MEETFTSELLNQTIIIENIPCEGLPVGQKTTVRLKESGQLIENISQLTIDMWPGKLVTATLTLRHCHRTENSPDDECETVTVENPEIHLAAIVEREEHYQAPPEAEPRYLKTRNH